MKDPLFKTRQGMAGEFDISVKTLYRWVQKHQIDLPKGLICPKFQKLIREKVFLEKTDE